MIAAVLYKPLYALAQSFSKIPILVSMGLLSAYVGASLYFIPADYNAHTIAAGIPVYVFGISRLIGFAAIFGPTSLADCLSRLDTVLSAEEKEALRSINRDVDPKKFEEAKEIVAEIVRKSCGLHRDKLRAELATEILRISQIHPLEPIKNGTVKQDGSSSGEERTDTARGQSWVIAFLYRDYLLNLVDIDFVRQFGRAQPA